MNLSSMKSLKKLELRLAPVSKKGVIKLKQALPKLQVTYDE
jgi:hypothetical protein